MNKDTPLGKVYYDERGVVNAIITCKDESQWPLEFKYIGADSTGFRAFIEERITPKSRQGLYESLQAAGIRRYNVAAMLKASNGRDCSDPFWIRFEDGPQTWKEVWEVVGVYNKE